MDMPSQPSDPLVASVLAVLKAAREQRCEINKTKLAKLLYLIDLQAVEDGGVQFSGATWRWDNYGPYDRAIIDAEMDLATSDIIDRVDNRANDGQCALTLTIEIDDPLPSPLMDIVRQVVREHGCKSATALKQLSYDTPPMIEAQAGGERGVLLDLSRVRRRKQFQAMLMRAKARRASRPVQQRDPDVGEQLLAELALSAESIRRANEKVLGDR
ncbi:Panacea domain-containing protein [Streptosporangium sp. NBC_01810]|uniref:type II toxin-antitoxin system antitoxin SocA domain-containing protein n=1 Tax=Streptosporangium sp. NBC_01810 TaxID=2975951 RepID=UPI002DDC3085|nr:type II toxin-antitoxin system antitoxin SocA domain-containing protein [Streptosporangium sp. NBC_01810]WSA23648.1 Panacea domain-containing protein [Streptosporangium sp. NBC_01810]